MMVPSSQHNVEIGSNRASWEKKRLLQEIYRDFYSKIAARLTAETHGLTVEIGSGMGNVKKVIPECITTDLFANPWLDRQENAYGLTFADQSIANLILFDVWHHLEYPGTALAEFGRVVASRGRLVIFDPAMSLLGKLIYGLFHHEPLGLKAPLRWKAPANFDYRSAPYFAGQAAATRHFWRPELLDYQKEWKVLEVLPLASLSYVASGGFSKRQLYPTSLLSSVRRVDRMLDALPAIFATRLLIVLERR